MTEEPCEKTGKGCDWVWEFNDVDMYCWDCYRDRDFSKDEIGRAHV
jgi:hypothetical protein